VILPGNDIEQSSPAGHPDGAGTPDYVPPRPAATTNAAASIPKLKKKKIETKFYGSFSGPTTPGERNSQPRTARRRQSRLETASSRLS